MSKRTRTFTDLDYNFTANPVTGDVSKRFDEAAIKASLRSLILTRNFERPFNSSIGTGIRNLLFENATPLTTIMLRRTIEDVILNYEPRVNIRRIDVEVSPDQNSARIGLEFVIINTTIPLSVDILLERTR